ncbi:universal stress protein [Mucilaginibacter sp.]|uniref:universal stress protein n=1 Tax=Mucilaginibacter sp. TaxID=1882438 RepID=UPI003267ADFE
MKTYKMLIAVAGGPDAENVALKGLLFGRPIQAEITLISIVKPILDVSDDGATSKEITAELRLTYEKSLQELTEKTFKDYPVKTFVAEGKPYSMILKIANDLAADVIVLGIHCKVEKLQFSTHDDFDELIKECKIPLILVPTIST